MKNTTKSMKFEIMSIKRNMKKDMKKILHKKFTKKYALNKHPLCKFRNVLEFERMRK